MQTKIKTDNRGRNAPIFKENSVFKGMKRNNEVDVLGEQLGILGIGTCQQK